MQSDTAFRGKRQPPDIQERKQNVITDKKKSIAGAKKYPQNNLRFGLKGRQT